MADLTIQDMSDEDGAAIAFAAADVAGDKYVWNSRSAIIVKNDDASAKQVTITPAVTTANDPNLGEVTRDNIVLSVAAGEVAAFPAPPPAFRDRADGNKVSLTYDAVTSLSVAIVDFGG